MPTPPETEPKGDGRVDLSLDALLADTEVTESREPGKEIREAKQPSRQEKLALHDLLREWLAMRPSSDNSPNGNVISANLRKGLLCANFRPVELA
ncbi:hypothetical protein FALBO_12736 [Fusarium albosuccineum]|uniref:Uncharacterized protein n=1 Tax=Fusarium albosuccineum TaxID=1237068 RepID=A0A8H4P7Q6_9HYPO|nr:hypothetical protein FALBO_12736 [Fusarium albosuccineum]